jgi:predicted transglutaminase-like cysteine proteinase
LPFTAFAALDILRWITKGYSEMRMRYFGSLLLSILMPFTLTSCSTGYIVESSVDNNYQLRLIHPTPHSHANNWVRRMAEAEVSIEQEQAELETSLEPHVKTWRDKLDGTKGLSELQQLERVNVQVNGEVVYITDYDHWNRVDRWGYPYEALVEGGDCEDIAMLKMESLLHLGWAQENFAILVGYSNYALPAESHAVLLAQLEDGTQFILDSLDDRILPPLRDHHFQPLYAVTPEHIYMVATEDETDTVNRLSFVEIGHVEGSK